MATLLGGSLDAEPTVEGGKRAVHRNPLTCLVLVEGTEASVRGVARALDLSSRGVGLLLTQPIALGARLEVELLVPPTPLSLRAAGEAVHCQSVDDGWRIGIRFDAPPALVDGPHSNPDSDKE